MARLTDKQREDIRNQLILGESQYSIARDYEVSSATVNKIFKTIREDEFLTNEVKEEIAIKSKLNNQSESLVKAFDDKVNEQLRRQGLVFNATEKLLKKIDYAMENHKPVEKVNIGEGIQRLVPVEYGANDYKNFADAIDKASLTLGVNQRHSNSQVNIQNTNAQQTNIPIQIEWE